jgi:hypothetical protein
VTYCLIEYGSLLDKLISLPQIPCPIIVASLTMYDSHYTLLDIRPEALPAELMLALGAYMFVSNQ